MSIAVGTRLGQYEVQDFIGQGAMGLVYRAYHADLERTGAVKVLQAITPDTDTIARFRHEAQAIAQLRHPNIVTVYDFGAFQGMPYMIVEYVPGGSLAARIAHGRLDQATTLKYLRGIAAGPAVAVLGILTVVLNVPPLSGAVPRAVSWPPSRNEIATVLPGKCVPWIVSASPGLTVYLSTDMYGVGVGLGPVV